MARSDRELMEQARRAYERGRLLAALPWAAIVLPLVATALLACGRPVLTCVQAAALWASIVALRWRGQDYGKGVPIGLVLGTFGFAVPFFSCASGLCSVASAPHLLVACCGAGVLAGLGLTAQALQ